MALIALDVICYTLTTTLTVEHFKDSYRLAPDAQALLTRLVRGLPEFAHLSAARIAAVYSEPTLLLHGQPCLAFVCQPHVQGPNSKLTTWLFAEFTRKLFNGEDPDYFIYIDHPVWIAFSPRERERVIFHELCHVEARVDENGVERRSPEDGRMLLKLVRHSYELFDSEIRKYGLEICGHEELAHAIVEGQHVNSRKAGAA